MTRMCIVSLTCDDCATWNRQKGGKYRALAITPEMKLAAEQLRAILSRYNAGIIVGQAESHIWNLDSTWDTGADTLLALL